MSEDLIWNMVANPLALVEIGTLARRADLTAELAELRRREVAVLVLWSDGDAVLPLASFDALCAAIGTDGTVLRGGHSWLLANPRALSEVLENVVRVQAADHETDGMRATTTELRALLRRTKIPSRAVTRLLTAASPLWMMSERPPVLAADLALCHPSLAAGEVRAVARPMEDPSTFRLTVVAADRAGLLADTAAALAGEGLTVLSASVATWPEPDVALHSITVRSTTSTAPDWDALGAALRSAARGVASGSALRADRAGHGVDGRERAAPDTGEGDRTGPARSAGGGQPLVRRTRHQHRGRRDHHRSRGSRRTASSSTASSSRRNWPTT